jgi:hypothetical protein
MTLRFLPFDQAAANPPEIPPAPAEVVAQAQRAQDTWTARIDSAPGNFLQPGRYYVVLENNGSSDVSGDVLATVTERERIQTIKGLWSPVFRGINQGIDWQIAGNNAFAVWYTYDEEGLPTFYISDGIPVDSQSSFVSGRLFRVTSNDERQTPKVVGRVQITSLSADRLMFAWRLNGRHGAELFNPVHGTSCPTIEGQERPVLGHWFDPASSAGGATVLITDSAEAWIRYYYDATNQPRWVLADEEVPSTVPGGVRMNVLDFRGFCIYCPTTPVTRQVVGTLERQWLAEGEMREISEFSAAAPLEGPVSTDRVLNQLSTPATCQ